MGKHEIVKVDTFRWSPPRLDLTAPYLDGIITPQPSYAM